MTINASAPQAAPAFADLTGQTALVTGSSSGIGRAIALELARAGADVIIHRRSAEQAAEAVADDCRAFGRRALVLAADLSLPSHLAPFVARAWEEQNPPQIWVNNAGVDLLTGADAKQGYADKLQRLLDMDVRSTVLL